MYKAGETVQYWGVKADGLTWLSAEALTGRILGRNIDEGTYVIEGRSVASASAVILFKYLYRDYKYLQRLNLKELLCFKYRIV